MEFVHLSGASRYCLCISKKHFVQIKLLFFIYLTIVYMQTLIHKLNTWKSKLLQNWKQET